MPQSIYDNGGYVGYTAEYDPNIVDLGPENGLTLTSSFQASSNIASSLFDRSVNVTFAADITFPASFNSDGTLFELGRTAIGAGVGLVNSGSTLRFTASDGANPADLSITAVLDIPTTNFTPGSSGTLVWDFQINPGRTRAWWNGTFLGEAFTSANGPLEGSVWSGTAAGSYVLATADGGPQTLIPNAWPGTAQSDLRYYEDQLVDTTIAPPSSSGIWSLTAVLESIEIPDSYEFIGSFEDINNLASYTFSGIDIGQTGLVVLSVGAEAFGTTNPQVVSVNVNGTNASGTSETIGNVRQSIWYIEELSTTTINVTVTFESAEINRMTLGVWRLDSYSSTIPNVYTDTGVDATRSITTATFPTRSVVIAGATEGQQGITTWTGVDKDYDTTTGEDLSTFSGGSIQLSSEQALAVSATFSVTGQNNSLMVAVWS